MFSAWLFIFMVETMLPAQSIFEASHNFFSNLSFFYIGQGTAHTGPALTPAEVLIAIHDINPEKDKVALKKVMSFTIIVLIFSEYFDMLYTINMALSTLYVALQQQQSLFSPKQVGVG
jgi:hypothetical protein